MTTYHVELVGVTWEGRKAAYSYDFDFYPTFEQIRQKSGDFQGVADYQTIEVARIGGWDETIVRRKIMDKWQHEENEEFYAEVTEAQ